MINWSSKSIPKATISIRKNSSGERMAMYNLISKGKFSEREIDTNSKKHN